MVCPHPRRSHTTVLAIVPFVVLVAALCEANDLTAQLIGINGPADAPITEPQAEKLVEGKPLVVLSEVEGFQVKRARAAIVLPYPADAVFAVVSGVEDFPSFMPYVAAVTPLEPAEAQDRAEFKLDFPWPVGSRRYVVRMTNTERENELGTASVSAWQYEAGSGNIVASEGEWEVTPLDEKHCLIRYMTFTDPGGHIPAWLQNASMDSAVPKVIKQVRKQVEATLAKESER